MSNAVELIGDSAKDFLNIVWPRVSQLPIIGGGKLKPVESVTEKGFGIKLDTLAGIDAWQVTENPSGIRGIASRVQWVGGKKRYDSFTIRTELASGNETEMQKRLRAINNPEEGCLYPHLTVQAFLNEKGGKLLSVAAIKTKELVLQANVLLSCKEKLRDNPSLYGFIKLEDGTEFLFMRWKYLKFHKILDDNNIIRVDGG